MIFQSLLTMLCLLNVTGCQVHANIAPSPVQQKIKVTDEQILKIIDADDLEKFTQIAPHVSSNQMKLVCTRLIGNFAHLDQDEQKYQDVKRYYDFLQAVIPYFDTEHFIHCVHVAMKVYNSFDVVKFFMERHRHQFSPNFIDDLLSWIIQQRCPNEKQFEYLLSYATTTNQALIAAVYYNNLKAVKILIPKADNIDLALMHASRHGYTEIVEFLVTSAIERGLRDIDFDGALRNAVTRVNNSKVITYLVPYCSDVSSALIAAVEFWRPDYLELILSHASNVPQKAIDNMLLEICKSKRLVSEQMLKIFDKYFSSVQDPLVHREILKHKDSLSLGSIVAPYCAELDPKLVKLYSSFSDHDWIHELMHAHHGQDNVDTTTKILLHKHKYSGATLDHFCQQLGIEQQKLIGSAGKLDLVAYQVTQFEQNDQKNNRTTFVHGRHWGWKHANDIGNMIKALKNNQSVITDTISLRQRDSNQNVDKLYEYRKKLIQEGVIGSYLVSSTNDKEIENERPERAEVTFMTYTGLSHLDCPPECSMRYFLQNHSATGGVSGYDYAKELIKKHGLEQYADDFEKLAQVHKAASEHGELLVISVNNNHLDEIVYPAKIGGYRYSDEKASEVTQRLSEQIRTNLQEYMLKEGSPIFCAAALDIPGEDSNKYKIQSITLADNVKHKAYLDQRNALFEKIKLEKHSNIVTWLQSCLVQQSEMFKQLIKNFKFSEHEL